MHEVEYAGLVVGVGVYVDGRRRYRSSALSFGVVLLPRFVKFTQHPHPPHFLLQHPHNH